MKFRGVFIGIDRYMSPEVPWLVGATKDAKALFALFTDTLEGESSLLLDEQATRASIATAFDELANCDSDDVVVVAFAGHGTPTHLIVTHDADPTNLENTCVSLDELTDWFSKIPARRLVFILDCCFSGGAGARVLEVPTPRDLTSVTSLLDGMSGEGRLILTASSANEEAWEDARFGHGLLTGSLIEVLLGSSTTASLQISVYDLLSSVAARVISLSTKLGKTQNPTLRGRIDGEFTWPTFRPGTLYAQYFPERVRQPATADLSSLSHFGFPAEALAAWSGTIGTLNALQVEAINEFGVLDNQDLVVVAPTSSGKTMVGELAALRAALERKRSFFLLPMRALVNDKHQEFVRRYFGYGLTVIRATGEIADDIPALMRGQYDICLMTYEKFTALALGSPHILRQTGVIVVDEVQMIADPSRGVNLEFLLTLLRIRARNEIAPQVICLSGVIGSTNGLERWLGARLLRSDKRPVPLNEGLILADGTFRYLDHEGNEKREGRFITPEWGSSPNRGFVIPLVRRLVQEGKQVIVFRETRGEARRCALYLAEALGLPPADRALAALPGGDPSNASSDLRRSLNGGVAFHISDLDRDERRTVEDYFRETDSQVKVIAATTTLAMGINTPAESAVIAGLQHPGGPNGDRPYLIAEYKNMAGRAGRMGFATQGESFLISNGNHEEVTHWNRYVQGTPEDVTSHFLSRSTDLRSLILRILAASRTPERSGLTAEETVEFLENSFSVFLSQAAGQTSLSAETIRRAFQQLQDAQMVEPDTAGRYMPTALGLLAGESGTEVESVIRLVTAVRGCSEAELTDPTLIALTQLTVELDQLFFPLNRRSTQKEPQHWPSELVRQGVAQAVQRSIQRNVSDQFTGTLRAKKTVSCLLWVTSTPLADIERILGQFGGAPNGLAGEIRSTAQRTVDLLPIVCRVAEILYAGLDLSERRSRLLTRLELGIPASMLQIARAAQAQLARADYLRLAEQQLTSFDEIAATEDERLLDCLDRSQDKVELLRGLTRRQQETPPSQRVPSVPVYEP